uniref:Uncharacterized protein n=1 Tax=Ditylenchus dipsaci TaxID=166011 RepID=A0A915ENR4_9BILA
MWSVCTYLAELLAWPISVFLCFLPIYYFLRFCWESIELPGRQKRAVFISGCDTGFGRLLAVKCAQTGIPCYAGCLTTKGQESLAEETQNSKHPAVVLSLDVAKDDSVNQAAKLVKEHLAKVDHELFAVVNNAGIFSIHGPDAWTSIEHYQRSIEVNLYGVIRCTHAFMPLLKKSKGRAYMDTIRLELSQYAICCLLEPGIFRTNLLDDKHGQASARHWDGYLLS